MTLRLASRILRLENALCPNGAGFYLCGRWVSADEMEAVGKSVWRKLDNLGARIAQRLEAEAIEGD